MGLVEKIRLRRRNNVTCFDISNDVLIFQMLHVLIFQRFQEINDGNEMSAHSGLNCEENVIWRNPNPYQKTKLFLFDFLAKEGGLGQ